MSNTRTRRSWAVVAVFVMAGAVSLIGAATSNADANFGFSRLQGSDRYDTAKDVAIKTFGTSDLVIVASGETFPDALSSAFAAGVGKAPVLLTKSASLPAPTKTAITTLGAKNAVIVGGTSAVSADVEKQLKDSGLSVTRLAGNNRYGTAVEVAKSGGASAIGKTGGPVPPASPTAIVVSGEAFPDALSAGPASDAAKLPILLTPQAGLASETKTFLGDSTYGIKTVLIIGGKAAVSQGVEDEIKAMGITVTRIAGTDRMDTAGQVADYELKNLTFSKAHVELARGDAFADALSAAPHAGKVPAPLLLTQDPTTLGSPTKTWLGAHKADLKDGHIFGGTSAVSDAVQDEAETAAGNTTGSTTTSSSSSTSSSLLGNTDIPGAPIFYSAVLNVTTTPPPTTSKVVLTYNEPVQCASVSKADYTITITDGDRENDAIKLSDGSTVTAAKQGDDIVDVVQCGNSGDTSSKTVTLTPREIITQRQEGRVDLASGAQVLDLGGNAQNSSDFRSFTGPKFKSVSFSNNGGSKFIVTYTGNLDCTSVGQTADPATGDYVVTDKSSNTAVQITNVSCSGDTVTIGVLTVVAGNKQEIALKDSSKVAGPRGELQPTDNTILYPDNTTT
jgi:putative cell wall-binding protein